MQFFKAECDKQNLFSDFEVKKNDKNFKEFIKEEKSEIFNVNNKEDSSNENLMEIKDTQKDIIKFSDEDISNIYIYKNLQKIKLEKKLQKNKNDKLIKKKTY